MAYVPLEIRVAAKASQGRQQPSPGHRAWQTPALPNSPPIGIFTNELQNHCKVGNAAWWGLKKKTAFLLSPGDMF